MDSETRSLRALARDLLDEFIAFDRRLLRTVSALLASPGLQSVDYVGGRREIYVSPIKLCIATGLLAGILTNGFEPQAYIGFAAFSAVLVPLHAAGLDDSSRLGSLILASIPWFALLIQVPLYAWALKLSFGRTRLFEDHLVLSIQLQTALFIAIALNAVVPVLLQIFVPVTVLFLAYATVAIREFYEPREGGPVGWRRLTDPLSGRFLGKLGLVITFVWGVWLIPILAMRALR